MYLDLDQMGSSCSRMTIRMGLLESLESHTPALTLRAFMKRRKALEDIISTSTSFTYSRYWRLVFMATSDFCFTIPLALWGIIANSVNDFQPFSWANIHSGYSRIPQLPRASFSRLGNYGLEITRWSAILCAFAFFGFFGLSSEAKKNYRLLASAIAKHLGITAFAESVAIPDPHVQSHLSFASAPVSFPSTTQSSALPGPSSAFPSIEEDVTALGAAPGPAPVRASTPVTPFPAPVDHSEKV